MAYDFFVASSEKVTSFSELATKKSLFLEWWCYYREMKRFYTPYLREYAGRKILLIVGPRQVGKTTLAKMFSSSYDYLNYDSGEDRQMYMEKSWDRKKEFIIFD